jgi:hypothetical protein
MGNHLLSSADAEGQFVQSGREALPVDERHIVKCHVSRRRPLRWCGSGSLFALWFEVQILQKMGKNLRIRQPFCNSGRWKAKGSFERKA